MTTFHEKLLLGAYTLVSSAFSTLGAIMTAGETRFVYVTFAVSTLMSGFLSLMFKNAGETIRLVIGRFGFAIMGGILLTKPVIHKFGFQQLADTDIISLAGLSALCCILTFTVGVALLMLLEKAAPDIAAKWFKKLTN